MASEGWRGVAARRRPVVVAIDGPSGSGKSSVSREVAQRLGTAYLDTGAMYRAVCWAALELGISLDDQDAVADLAGSTRLGMDLSLDPRDSYVEALGRDITRAIRSPLISELVSKVATNLKVRAIMQDRQRKIIADCCNNCGVVAEGRDITTVVAPDADVRILLTASEAVRIARRQRELLGSSDQDLAATTDQIVRRDADDSTVSQFMDAPKGVQLLDTSDLSFDDTVDEVVRRVREMAATID
jgi:cytidylate kinase